MLIHKARRNGASLKSRRSLYAADTPIACSAEVEIVIASRPVLDCTRDSLIDRNGALAGVSFGNGWVPMTTRMEQARITAFLPRDKCPINDPRALASQPNPSAEDSPTSMARHELYERFSSRIVSDVSLSRRLISYQGNKAVPGLRWLKYKEGFSTTLVRSLLENTPATSVLDPFSGSGTTVLTASSMGMDATGIELMPLGNLCARGIMSAATHLSSHDISLRSKQLLEAVARDRFSQSYLFPHVAITEYAFSLRTEEDLAKARQFIAGVDDVALRDFLTLLCVSVLEDVSFTRKDGQFLRWDPRSGRSLRSKLHKGHLPTLSHALERRLADITHDLPFLSQEYRGARPHLIDGSSLRRLKDLPSESFDAVVTSPPYANRYDYTRTYALELVFLGYDDSDIKRLRQDLLSATVENKSKRDLLAREYDGSSLVASAFEMADGQGALQESLDCLKREAANLSNRNVIGLIENYFTEMAVVICELGRLVRSGGSVFMVNDNVRYHGQEIPVDLILSDFAEQAGFSCECIRTLTRGKGNSSQQMGRFGRSELRKCIYHWRKL